MSHSPTHPPSPAVEVVATLGDSVVGVAHVSNPTGGATTRATRAMIIGGAIGIVAGALAFFAATRIAAGNHAALAAWVGRHKPAWSFRPEFVPAWYSVVSFLGFSCGLTALIAGLSRRKRELEPATVVIGSAAGVDFPVEGTATPAHALVAPQGGQFVLNLAGMTGEITVAPGAPALAIAPMAAPLFVTEGLRVRAQVGRVDFHISATEAPRRHTTPVLAMLDRRALGFVAASAAAHLALFLVSRMAGPEPMQSSMLFDSNEELSYRMVNVENLDKVPEPDPTDDVGDANSQNGKMAMALEMGTVGDKNDNSAHPATRQIKDRNTDPQLARQEALEAARSAGVIGAIHAEDAFASIVGTGQVSSGFSDADITGAIAGDGEGAPNGWGQGASGNMFGGGGNSYQVGGYNTFTNGDRNGESFGIPGSRGCKATSGVCRKHEEVAPPPRLGKPDVIGDYDGSIIRRYVKRKIAQISYCYENQLLAHPDLEGTVMATWTINMSGLVQGASAKGVSSEVSSCIANVISSIEFPKPPQVGVYQVRYPFVLHKHGQ